MKKLILLYSLAVLSLTVSAQKIKVTESSEHIGGGTNSALVVTIYESTPDVVEKDVKSLLKDYNAKVSSKDDGWYGHNAIVKKMASDTVDIYAKWDKGDDNQVTLIMAFSQNGDFISSSGHREDFNVAKEIVQTFATKATYTGISLLVRTEQKTFDKLSNDQQRLEKENKDLNDDIVNYNQTIEDYKQKIKKAQDDIETNKSSQGKKKDEMAVQQKVLDTAKDKQKMVD